MTMLANSEVVAPGPEAPAPPTRGPRRPSWLRGWKVPMRLARRDLRRRPVRTVLVALLVALPVTALALSSVAYRSDGTNNVDWVAEQFGAADAVARVDNDAALLSGCAECISRADVEALLPEGTRHVWATQTRVPLRTPDQQRAQQADVSNVDPTDPIHAGAYTLAEGAWPQADNEAALGALLAESLDVSIGDEFSLAYQEREFTMVGVIERGPSMVAPGFDFSVVRALNLGEFGRFDLPAPYDASALTFDGWSGRQIEVRPDINFWENYDAGAQSAIDQEVIMGWLAGVVAMSVLGVVVAAAFAISGRRQLVAVGQLSASGASQRTLVRTFGLSGALAGAVGVVIGLVGAVSLYRWRPRWFGDIDPRVAWLDIAVIAATAIVVATVAALAPTRSLTRVSVLSALAGRRPVGAVPSWLNRVGLALFLGGLLVTLMATRAGADGGGSGAGMLVAVGMIAVVLGVCASAPRIVDHLGGVAARRGGSVRLAARSTTRHRPRAAALLASLLVVGMAATGVAALLEDRLQQDEADRAAGPFIRSDMVWVNSTVVTIADAGVITLTPASLSDLPALHTRAEQAMGSTSWTSASLAYQPSRAEGADGLNVGALVATDEVLDLLGLAPSTRAFIAGADGPVMLDWFENSSNNRLSTFASEVGFDLPWALLSPQVAVGEDWSVVPNAVEFGVAMNDLSLKRAIGVWALNDSISDEGLAYLGGDDTVVRTSWSVANYVHESFRLTPTQGRLLLLGFSLLLVVLLISIGMALWAVESRDERDVLVAIGASPATMARIAGWRAGGLTLGAMLIAVPMGFVVSWAVARAAHASVATPWLLAGLLLSAVPVVIGVGAFACSALAQRFRPVRMSTLSMD